MELLESLVVALGVRHGGVLVQRHHLRAPPVAGEVDVGLVDTALLDEMPPQITYHGLFPGEPGEHRARSRPASRTASSSRGLVPGACPSRTIQVTSTPGRAGRSVRCDSSATSM